MLSKKQKLATYFIFFVYFGTVFGIIHFYKINNIVMKKNLLLVIAIIMAQFVFAQQSPSAMKIAPINYDEVEIKPEFPGGYDELMKFIGRNFQPPEVEGLSGIVKISFVVEITGKIAEIKILKDLGSGTGEEAKRVMAKSPNWLPGSQDGKPVRVVFELPITIKTY